MVGVDEAGQGQTRCFSAGSNGEDEVDSGDGGEGSKKGWVCGGGGDMVWYAGGMCVVKEEGRGRRRRKSGRSMR